MTASPDRTVVVTGASSGIGKASAEAFARLGWHVIGTGRDPARCQAAEAELRAIPGARVDFLRGDFTEMGDVRRIASEIAQLTDRVHVLVNNAGGVRDGFHTSSQGLEATFAANHLAAFLLTRELLPLMEKAAAENAPGTVRIIAVSSSAHHQSPGMNWDDLMLREGFHPATAYCHAKLANLLFTRELNRRLHDRGIIAQAMHPGTVGSNFANHGDAGMQAYMASQDLVPPERPARTVVWLATSAEAGKNGGRYFQDEAEIPAGPQALDDEAAIRLWNESTRILETV